MSTPSATEDQDAEPEPAPNRYRRFLLIFIPILALVWLVSVVRPLLNLWQLR